PAALRRRLILKAIAGKDSTTATLRVSGARGSKEVRLLRSFLELSAMHTTPKPFEILPGNLGYVRMDRLLPSEVDSMFDALKGTRALIFDLRGYPNGTAWQIAPHIHTQPERIGATFERAMVSGGETGRYKFEQEIPSFDVTL